MSATGIGIYIELSSGRGDGLSTAAKVTHGQLGDPAGDCRGYLAESLLVCLLFAALASGPVPDVNESHYWTKARSFWDPDYGARDLFLQSADAHYVFYLTLGTLAGFLKLPVAVWVARWLVWGSMALGWTYLSRTFSRSFGTSILSAGLLVVLTRWFHLAGEWVVGGAEAKGLAFACVFFAMASACRRRWNMAWIWGGLGAAFHVLVGGWVVLALLFTWFLQVLPGADGTLEKRQPFRWQDTVPGLLVGGAFSLLGLVPAIALNWGVPEDVSLAGARIYSLDRISHHLAIWAFAPNRVLVFTVLLLGWLWLANRVWQLPMGERGGIDDRLRILTWISVGSLAIAGAGFLIGVGVLESRFQWEPGIRWLRFYWFRCSDFLIPAYLAIVPFAFSYPATRLVPWAKHRNGWGRVLCATALLLVLVEGGLYWRNIQEDPRPAADRMSLPGNMDSAKAQQYYRNWVRACFWVRDNTPEDALFLTPRSQQTFKWYAERSEVICWKDVPQDSGSLLEWIRRARDCFPHTESEWGFAVNRPEELENVIRRYQVDYLLIPQYAYELKDRFGRQLPYPMVYPENPSEKSTFVVLKVPADLKVQP